MNKTELKKQVRAEWLTARMNVKYHDTLNSHFETIDTWIRWVGFATGGAAVATLIQGAPAWISVTLTLIVALLNAASAAYPFGPRASDHKLRRQGWVELRYDFEALQREVKALPEEAATHKATARFNELMTNKRKLEKDERRTNPKILGRAQDTVLREIGKAPQNQRPKALPAR